jgi:serine/threonine protein kinase
MRRRYHDADKHVPHGILREFVKQMASAFEHLHDEKGVIHKDIKPANILVRILPPEQPVERVVAEPVERAVANNRSNTITNRCGQIVNSGLNQNGDDSNGLISSNETSSRSCSGGGCSETIDSTNMGRSTMGRSTNIDSLDPKKPPFRIQFLIADFGLATTIAYCKQTDGKLKP